MAERGSGAVETLINIAHGGETDWLEKKAAIYVSEEKDPAFRAKLEKMEKCSADVVANEKRRYEAELLRSIACALVALHNSRGGVLLVGIDDANNPVPLSECDGDGIFANEGLEAYVRKSVIGRLCPKGGFFECGKANWTIPADSLGIVSKICQYKGTNVLALLVPPLKPGRAPVLVTKTENNRPRRMLLQREPGDIGEVRKTELAWNGTAADLADFHEEREQAFLSNTDLFGKLSELDILPPPRKHSQESESRNRVSKILIRFLTVILVLGLFFLLFLFGGENKQNLHFEKLVTEFKYAVTPNREGILPILKMVEDRPNPNVDFPTLGGHFWWDTLAEANGWKFQRHKLFKQFRILDGNDFRRAWGWLQDMERLLSKRKLLDNVSHPKQTNQNVATEESESRETPEPFPAKNWTQQCLEHLREQLDYAIKNPVTNEFGRIVVGKEQILIWGDIPDRDRDTPPTILLDGGMLLLAPPTSMLQEAVNRGERFISEAPNEEASITELFEKADSSVFPRIEEKKDIATFRCPIEIGENGGRIELADEGEPSEVFFAIPISRVAGVETATLNVFGFSGIILARQTLDSGLTVTGCGKIAEDIASNGLPLSIRWFDAEEPL